MRSLRRDGLPLWAVLLLVLAACGGTVLLLILRPRAPGPRAAADYYPAGSWRTAVPEEQGFDSAGLAEALKGLSEKQVNIDSLLIIRNGYLILDAHFHPYDGSFPHDLASVTKSVMTTLIGMAADQGKLRLDAPVVSFFPDRVIANLDERKKSMTVRDLAGMVNGMESACLDGDEATLDTMRSEPDWVQAALDRKMVQKPGTRFCYDSPGMHLLSAILQEATGMTALEFAEQHLFQPLGIEEYVWESDPQGYTCGWGNLHLKPEDAAKIGYLWLNRGAWDGQQIVPADWVTDSVQAHSKWVGEEFGYGLGWWISHVDYYAMGREGQFIRALPALNMVIVATGGGYDFGEVESFLIPMLLRSGAKRPENPTGAEQLHETLGILLEEPVQRTASSISQDVRAVSGRVYACDPNPAGIESLWIDLTGSQTASVHFRQFQRDVVLSIGLDGQYRLSEDGQASRGAWEDAQTFTFEVFDIGSQTRKLHFEGDRLQVSVPEAGLTLECQVQKP